MRSESRRLANSIANELARRALRLDVIERIDNNDLKQMSDIILKYSDRALKRTLPRERAFHFFTSIGNYTGVWASSLGEFVKKIFDVDVKSLEFHLYRGDFENWVDYTLGDGVLASKIRQLKALKPIGIDLRDRLFLIVYKHHENIVKQSERPPPYIWNASENETVVGLVEIKGDDDKLA